jgi:WD40 repeat protein
MIRRKRLALAEATDSLQEEALFTVPKPKSQVQSPPDLSTSLPGAFRAGGAGTEADDDADADRWYNGSSRITVAPPPTTPETATYQDIVSATLVQEDNDEDGEKGIAPMLLADDKVVIAVPETTRNRRLLYFGILALVVIVVVIVLAVSLSGGDSPVTPSPSPTNTSLPPPSTSPEPSQAPTVMPTAPQWEQLGYDLFGVGAGDRFGESVSLSDDGLTLAVGAQNYNLDDGSLDAGMVQVYKFQNNSWLPLGQILTGDEAGDWFGDCVALSGDASSLAVFANATGSISPYIRVYSLNETNGLWTRRGSPLSDGYGGDKDSLSISSNGRVLAVGSPRDRVVRVYEFREPEWVPVGQDLVGRLADDEFGRSVSLSGDGWTVLIGAPRTVDGSGGGEVAATGTPQTGYAQAHRYSNSTGQWSLYGLEIRGEWVGDEAGWSVGLSRDGTRAIVGSVLNDEGGENAGNARVFEYNVANEAWIQIGQRLIGEHRWDNSGYSVAISADGSVVAIGAPGNQGAPEELEDNNAGHVRVFAYDVNASQWMQIGADIDGVFFRDESGYDISLSGDGGTVAVGGPFSSWSGKSRAGYVRVLAAPPN